MPTHPDFSKEIILQRVNDMRTVSWTLLNGHLAIRTTTAHTYANSRCTVCNMQMLMKSPPVIAIPEEDDPCPFPRIRRRLYNHIGQSEAESDDSASLFFTVFSVLYGNSPLCRPLRRHRHRHRHSLSRRLRGCFGHLGRHGTGGSPVRNDVRGSLRCG